MKTQMKTIATKISAILLAGVSMAGLQSCDYLDIEPEKTLPGESVDYTRTEEMYEAVSGCYAAVRTYNMHWILNLLTVIRDGDVWSGRTDDQGDLVTMGNTYIYNSAWWGINETWRNYYQIIRICNSALSSLDEYEAHITSEDDMKRCRSYRGEVKIIRSLAYYRLAQFFGNVPILADNYQTDYTPSERNVVYEYVLRDLDYAMTYTPKVRPNQMEHVGAFSGYTAQALAAKVYLQMGNYEKVEELTDGMISSGLFTLYNDYYQLWKIPGRLCDESLAECQVTDFGMGSGDYIGVDQFFNCAGPTISNPNTTLQSTGGWNFVGYFDSFYDWAIDRGETVRATTTFLVGGTETPSGDYVAPAGNANNTNIWNGKWYLPLEQITPGRTEYGCNNNVRILRYADVLLMNAEAKVRLGRNGDEPFNAVRRRAAMPELRNVDVDMILDERRMELCCEWGERYADLVRTGKAAQVLGPKGWSPDKTYFPIPSEQLDLAPELMNPPYTSLER